MRTHYINTKMKNLIVLLISLSAIFTAAADEAKDFQCKDCNGQQKSLYAELASGSTVVICWVMPCGSCVGPALTCYNVVNNYQSKGGGRVVYYMVDDFADTDCGFVTSWATGYNMPPASFMTQFSCSSIKMRDYGSTGMPKTIVIGPNKKVYYNANNTINFQQLIAAIDAARADSPSSVQESAANDFSVFPNPAGNEINIRFDADASNVALEITDNLGRIVFSRLLTVSSGETIDISSAELPAGIYSVRLHTLRGIQSSHLAIIR